MEAAGGSIDSPTRPDAGASARIGQFALRAIWLLAVGCLALIVAVTLRRTLIDYLIPLASDLPGPYGRAGLAFVGAYLAAAAVGLAAVWRLSGTAFGQRRAFVVCLVAAAIAIRLVIAIVADGRIGGETQIVRNQALGVADGACCFSHRPTGYPIALSAAFGLFGEGPVAIEALNLLFAGVTAWLVWDIGRVAWNRRAAAMAAGLYAIVPSQILLVLVPLTEPMYAALVAAAVRLALATGDRLPAALGIAAILATAQYVRATAVALLVPFVMLPWLAGERIAAVARRAAVIGVTFVILMLPVVGFNLHAHGDLSVSTSAYGGWSLYVGTNAEHGGMWNAEDAARLAGFPGTTWWDRSEHAGRLAMERITADPGTVVALAPRKFVTMWADETYAATYALGPPSGGRATNVAWLTSQLVWTAIVVLALVGLVADRRRPRLATVLIGGIVVLVAASHLLLEVHSRYHSYLVPLLCVLAGAGVLALSETRGGRVGWRRRV